MGSEDSKRKKITRDRIQEAFLEEIQEKELKDITVTQICKKADVNRGSFYSNFLDVYDLADQILHELQAEVEQLYHGELMEDMRNDRPFFLGLFEHIRTHPALFKTCFKLNYEDSIAWPEEYYMELGKKLYDPDQIEYHYLFFKAGFNAVVRKWLEGGCRETPEEMLQIINEEYKGKIFEV